LHAKIADLEKELFVTRQELQVGLSSVVLCSFPHFFQEDEDKEKEELAGYAQHLLPSGFNATYQF